MTYTYTLTDHADEDIRKQIVEPLVRFNEAQAGPSHYRPLVVKLSDAEDKVVGGMWGATGYGWLFTQLLVVPDSARAVGASARVSCSWPNRRRLRAGATAHGSIRTNFRHGRFMKGSGMFASANCRIILLGIRGFF